LRRWLAATAVLAVWAAGPSVASAGNYCVDASSTVLDWSSCFEATPCSEGTYTSIQDALDVAVAAGEGPSAVHEFCIFTPGVHEESIEFNDPAGDIGEIVSFAFLDGATPNWCPDPAEPGPGFSFTGSPFLPQLLGIHQLRTNGSCSAARPLVESVELTVDVTGRCCTAPSEAGSGH